MLINYLGNNLNVEIVGQGKPILFLHGWGGSTLSFSQTIKFLKKSYKCISIDFSGFGLSDEPNEIFDISDYAKEVIHIIKSLEINSCDIISHSFGGRVALYLLAEYGKYFRKAILVAPAGIRPKRNIKYYIKIYTYKIKKKFARSKKSLEKLQNCGSNDYRNLSPKMKEVFKKVVNFDMSEISKKIENNVLLIYGEGDSAVTFPMIKTLHKNITNSKILILDGGHFCYISENYTFCKIVKTFLEVENAD